MATVVKEHKVGPGKPQTTIATWESTHQRNLASLDEFEIGHFFANDYSEDVDLAGWGVTTYANRIVMWAHFPDRSQNLQNESGKVRWTGSSFCLTVQQEFTQIYGFIFHDWGAGTTEKFAVHLGGSSGAQDSFLMDCVADGGSSPHLTASGFSLSRARTALFNCAIMNLTGANGGTAVKNATLAYDDQKVYCCAIFNVVDGILAGNAVTTDLLAVDNSVLTASGTCYTGTYNASSATNMASDTTAPGTGSLQSKTAANNFVDTTAGSEDLRQKRGGDGDDVGTGFETDANVPRFGGDGRPRGNNDDVDLGIIENISEKLRSVGTKAQATDGTVDVNADGSQIDFSADRASDIGIGDKVVLDPSGTPETVHILKRISAQVFSLQVASAKTSQTLLSFELDRAHPKLDVGAGNFRDAHIVDADKVTDDERIFAYMCNDSDFGDEDNMQIDDLVAPNLITDHARYISWSAVPRNRYDGDMGGPSVSINYLSGSATGLPFVNSMGEGCEIAFVNHQGAARAGASEDNGLANISSFRFYCRIHDCISHDAQDTGSGKAVLKYQTSNMNFWYLYNMVGYNIEQPSNFETNGMQIHGAFAGHMTMHKCGQNLDNNDSGQNPNAELFSIASTDGADYDYETGGSPPPFQATSSHNLDVDGTAPGTDTITTTQARDGTLYEATTGSPDFHPANGSSDLVKKGRNIFLAEFPHLILNDLSNVERKLDEPDIGAFEFVEVVEDLINKTESRGESRGEFVGEF